MAFWWSIVGDLDENGTLMGSDNASTRAREALSAGHPGSELLAERDQLYTSIKLLEAEGNDVRAALATAQAELDRSQPIVIAAARLASGPDSAAWQALYAALERPPDYHITERQQLLRIALAAWRLSDECAEFNGPVSSETIEALDQALIAAFGDADSWYVVRDRLQALIAPKVATDA